jgi:ERCC4-type nuclease
MTLTAVMIDTREPDWVRRLTFGGVPTSPVMLEHGDLMLATGDGQIILIERKTPDDFLGSLKDGRLFPQLAGMLEQTRWCYLLITEELTRGQNGMVVTNRGSTGWNWAAVQGALLSIQEMGVFVVFAAGDTDYEACVQRIAARDRKTDLLLTPAKFPRVLTASEQIIASLPGIGVERLQTVMGNGMTPAWALAQLTDRKTVFPGIADGIKARIRTTLGLRNNTELVIVTDEDGHEMLKVSEIQGADNV